MHRAHIQYRAFLRHCSHPHQALCLVLPPLPPRFAFIYACYTISSDVQIVNEVMLEDINNILNAGDVPNLYAPEDLDSIMTACRYSIVNLSATPVHGPVEFRHRKILAHKSPLTCREYVGVAVVYTGFLIQRERLEGVYAHMRVPFTIVSAICAFALHAHPANILRNTNREMHQVSKDTRYRRCCNEIIDTNT